MIDTKKLAKELKSCSEENIFLVETSASKLLEVHLAVVKWFIEKKHMLFILSASRPCKNLLNLYNENSIDTNKIIVLCTVCQEKEEHKHVNNNVIHLSSSSSLTEISFSLNKCIESIKGKKFIFIDSIDTLLIHNEPNTLAIFIHSILTKMRTNNVSGLLISLKSETNKEVRAEIVQLCDKVIKI
jgi:hypothetical protein